MTSVEPFVAIVDDEAAVRRAISRLLRSAGMAVVAYASGPEFLAVVHASRPICIVLDLHMPRMDGFDVHDHLRATAIDTPVILITGHDTAETRARADAIGVAAYFRKPVDDQALIEAINRCARRDAPA